MMTENVVNTELGNFTVDDEETGLGDAPVFLSPVPTPPPAPIMPPPPPPGAMMMGTGGTYHPDFMFCGTCADCQDPDPNRVELDEDERLETYLDDESVRSEVVIIKTKFQQRKTRKRCQKKASHFEEAASSA